MQWLVLLATLIHASAFLEKQHAQSLRSRSISSVTAPAIGENASAVGAEVCAYVLKALKPIKAVNGWPLTDCAMADGVHVAKAGEGNAVSLAVIEDALQTEQVWARVPAGSIVIVKVQDRKQDQDLVWQTLYQSQSRLYFQEFCGMTEAMLGLPGLQYVGFLKGHIVLQKANYDSDVQNSHGEFYNLAKKFGTDKIDNFHNYSLLYHRHLDVLPKNVNGAMVEVGLGCTMSYGPGASAEIWPRMFPQLAVHFIEINRTCTEKWLPQMQKSGVKKVHIGSQNDPAILNEVIKDASAVPGGIRLVIDDGSHECDHMCKTFKSFYPEMASGGLYFAEDIMYSSWGTSLRQQIHHKHQRTTGTMIAVAAEHATAVIGFPRSGLAAMTKLVECTPGHCLLQRK